MYIIKKNLKIYNDHIGYFDFTNSLKNIFINKNNKNKFSSKKDFSIAKKTIKITQISDQYNDNNIPDWLWNINKYPFNNSCNY